MGDYDHLIPKPAGSYDHLIPKVDDNASTMPKFSDPEVASAEKEKALRALYKGEIFQRGEPGYGERFIDSATMGVSRPLSGAVRVVGGLFDPDSTAGERWRAGVGAAEDYFQKGVENTPGALGVATDLAGGLAGGVGGATRAGLASLIARGAAQGAIEGASRNARDLPSAAAGAGIGGALGGATSAAAGTVGNWLTKGAAKEVGEASRGGTAKAVKGAASEIFEKLDNAGIHYKDTTELANKANAALADSAYSRNVPANVQGVMKEINDRVEKGAMTYGDIRKIETQLSDLKASGDPGTRTLAKDVGKAVSEFLDTAHPTMPASSVGQVAAGDLAKAKDLRFRGGQAETVEKLATKGTKSAPDPVAKVQKNFENYADKFTDSKRYNKLGAHMDAVNEIATGSPKRQALAEALNYKSALPYVGGGLGAATGAASVLGGSDKTSSSDLLPAGAAGLGVLGGALLGGRALRNSIARTQADQVNNLLKNIIANPNPDPASRAALAKLIMGNAAARGAGTYAGSLVDKKD